MRQVERELGINHSSIRKCCKGEQKTAGGFKWEYVKEEGNMLHGNTELNFNIKYLDDTVPDLETFDGNWVDVRTIEV